MLLDSHSDYWAKGPVVLLVMRFLVWEANAERARRRGTAAIFSGSSVVRILIASLVIMLAWLMLKDWKQEEIWLLTFVGVFIFLVTLVWPSTIWLLDTGIEERRWWRPKKFIPWDEVTAIQTNKGGDKAVFGRSGQCICLDRFHVGPNEFEFEVRRRANLKETLDASAPLTLGLQEYPRIPVGLPGRRKTTRRERSIEKSSSSADE